MYLLAPLWGLNETAYVTSPAQYSEYGERSINVIILLNFYLYIYY